MKKIYATKKSQNRNSEERILNESMRLFLERGYHGTSIDDITKAAGLTKGALYWHFKDKEDLLKRIIKEFEKRFLDGLIQAVNGVQGSFIDKIEKYFRYNSAFAYYNRDLMVSFTTLSGELVGAHHPIEPGVRRVYKKWQNFVSSLILQGKKEKFLKEEIDPDLTALIMIAYHCGNLFQWSMNRDKIDGEAYVNLSKKIILKGLMI
jgi:AcrR family transcriptional regulator